MTLEELSTKHDYYCSDSNYYSNDPSGRYATWADFYEEFHDSDIDMNLIFRWDIGKRDNSNRYFCQIFMIHQRKGIFSPIYIDYMDESDVDSFVQLIKQHWDKLTSIWTPISQIQ